MATRIEIFITAYLIAAFLVDTVALFALGGNSFAYGLVSPIIIFPIFIYSTYLAFEIRHALAVSLYRNQALGIGLVAIVYGIAWTLGSVAGGNPVISFGIYLAYVVAFYWIDTSILAARRSDPLLRNTFHWKQLRRVLWPLIILGLITLAGAISNALPSIISNSEISDPILVIFPVLIIAVVTVPSLVGVIWLPVVARRSGDSTLRKHLLWFGFFALMAFLIIARFAVPQMQSSVPLVGITGSALLLAEGYCLYRSTRSLVPLNRLTPTGRQRK